jgi:hypothetical protein
MTSLNLFWVSSLREGRREREGREREKGGKGGEGGKKEIFLGSGRMREVSWYA